MNAVDSAGEYIPDHLNWEVIDAAVCVEERRLNGMLRRLADDEKPLQLCLRWSDDGADSLSRRQFVLQDNVTSEIAVRLIRSAFTLTRIK